MKTLEQLYGTTHPVAVITGSGAPRVGNHIARSLAERGFRIVLHCNTSRAHADETAEQIEAVLSGLATHSDHTGPCVAVVQGAIESSREVERMFDQIDQQFGRVDVLVNSAAIWSPQRFEAVTEDDIRRNFEVNALGTFLAAKSAGLRMAGQSTGGSIINIGDWATVRPYMDHVAYFASKGSIPTLTRSLALELAERNRNVRVNAILPGPVMLSEDISEPMRQANENSTLLGRVGDPSHVAHAVMFLIENDFVTGVCLPVDGGRTIYAGDPMQVEHRCG